MPALSSIVSDTWAFSRDATHPWQTRALVEHVLRRQGLVPILLTVWEPAAGAGYMARPLSEYFGTVITTDICDRGYRGDAANGARWLGCHDFLSSGVPAALSGAPIDWIITRPPDDLARAFAERAIGLAGQGVALLLPSSFLFGEGCDLFTKFPPNVVAQLGDIGGTFQDQDATGQLDREANRFCWFVWLRDDRRRPAMAPGDAWAPFWWIPRCRQRLSQKADYPPYIPAAPAAIVIEADDISEGVA